MKSLKFKVFTLIFIFFSIFSIAQEGRDLEGVVTDQEGNPLPGVTVSPKGLDYSVETDDEGYYQIESLPESVLTLIFEHPDMMDASASVGLSQRIDVQMSLPGSETVVETSLEDLLNMSVTTVSKSAERMSDAPGAISVISQDELQRFGGLTLKEVLERVPSLIGSTVYMTDRSTIAPRGDQVLASSSHVLMLINGRPVREALEGGIKSEMYEAFPVDVIDKIEVIRGPGSVLYGSNAFSAVINVITKETEGNHINISGLGSIQGGYGGSGDASLKTGDLGVTVAAKYLKRSEWETDWTYADPTSSSGATTKDLDIPNEGLGTYMGLDYKNLHVIASYNEWKNYYFVPDYAFVFPAHGDANWNKSFLDLGYDLEASENWNMDFNVTYTRSKFNTQNWPNTNRDSYEAVGEWSNYYNPTDKLGIVFGGLFNYFTGEEWGPTPASEKVVYTDNHRHSFGAYAQLNYALLSELNVIGGIQANKVEGIDLNIVPRIGMIWYPVSRFNVKAFYSEAFRAPSINEFFINFPEMQGNPDLVPEEVSTIDVGFGYQGDQFNGSVNFFSSHMKNLIFQNRDTTVVPAPMYWNGAEVDFMGFELEGRYFLNSEWYLTGSMLYQTNEDKLGREDVTPIANTGFKAGLSYKSAKGITASAFNIYQGSMDSFYDAQFNPSPGSYNVLNVHLDFDLANLFNMDSKNKFSFYVHGNNILDQEIWLPSWGLTPGTSIPSKRGRTIYFGLKIPVL